MTTMVARNSHRFTVPLAALIAGVLAVVSAIVIAVLPGDTLSSLVLANGIAALAPVAAGPLGPSARAALTVMGGGGIGLLTWFTFYVLIGGRTISLRGPRDAPFDVPVLRRADAHPDAPVRRPLFATQDLGTPFLDIRAPAHVMADAGLWALATPGAAANERAIPVDLDVPTAYGSPPGEGNAPSFNPFGLTPDYISNDDALLPDSADPERFETFELTPMVRPTATSSETPSDANGAEEPPSIQALLDRLEKGVSNRAPAMPLSAHDQRLQESLAILRRLASNA
ncbi:hypothetical protein [Sphingomonas qilianensis]|uniref:hypothetical protein n=1 Tax=Sphingomonas qilianensis TaxID=1736690 RepID=UPI0031F5B84D